MITQMGIRIKQALIWYDTASKKYIDSLNMLKEIREKIENENSNQPTRTFSENPLIKAQKEKVRRYEEKLYRASIVLQNITSTMHLLQKCEERREIVINYDNDEDDD